MSNSIFPAGVRGLTYTVVKTQENSVLPYESENFAIGRVRQNANPKWHWRFEYTVLIDNVLYPNPLFQYTDLQQMLGFCQSMYLSYDDFLYLDPDDNSVGPGVITATWQPTYPYMLGAIIIVSGQAWQVTSAPGGAQSRQYQPTFSASPQQDGGLLWNLLGSIPSGATGWPNPQAQLQIFSDGTYFYTPIQRNLGGQFWEDITDLNGGITVYANGVLQPSGNYTIGWGGLPSGVSGYYGGPGLYLRWASQPASPVTATFNYYFRVRFEEPTLEFEKFVNQFWAIGGDHGNSGKGYMKFMSAPKPLVQLSYPNGLFFPPPPSAPPIPVPPGAKMLILYPTIGTATNGSGPGTLTGYGVAAPPDFITQANLMGLGSVGGQVELWGCPDPTQPPYSISRSRMIDVQGIFWLVRTPGSIAGAFNGWGTASGGILSAPVNGIGAPIGAAGYFLNPGNSGFTATYIITGSVVQSGSQTWDISNINFPNLTFNMADAGPPHNTYNETASGVCGLAIIYH